MVNKYVLETPEFCELSQEEVARMEEGLKTLLTDPHTFLLVLPPGCVLKEMDTDGTVSMVEVRREEQG